MEPESGYGKKWMSPGRQFLRHRRFAKGLALLSFVTTFARFIIHVLHVYQAFSCQLNDSTLSQCSKNASSVEQSAYDRVEIASFYLEGFSMLAFLLFLIFWPAYRFKVLFKYHLVRMPQLYTLAPLVVLCIVLESLSTIDTTLRGTFLISWELGYTFGMLTYLAAALTVVHIDGKTLHQWMASLFPREPIWRQSMHWSWLSFLTACAVHQVFFAGYDATLLDNVLRQATTIQHTNIDTLGLMVAITTRSVLAKTFFDKLFDWPLPSDVTEEARRVNSLSPHLLYDAVINTD